MDDFFVVNIGFPRTNCIRTDGLDPRIVPGSALWTHDNRAEPVLRSEGPPHPPTLEASTDTMHVVHPRAAGLDVHKMEITATVRLCSPEGGDPEAFSTLESGMRDLVAWLRGHGVTGAEATGWELPALEDVGIRVDLCAARQAGAGKPM